ncbi:family 43 glycosylhydrolase [Labilibaculum manganireducens]|uniref:family 43 glycosylhydrolase n=1 Tax=Labilibaculum manganireducens TaxID=1940525 RepID=UPI0029F52952|nr:family 43 glycosylhydrolase [Labilibaculum manganireducens]
MNQQRILLGLVATMYLGITSNTCYSQRGETICNPLNINYRFQLDQPSRREAADPSVIQYQDGYLLFASMSGGYWYSEDLANWEFIESDQIPKEEYAPTAISIGDTVYFLASSTQKSTIYKTTDPLSGKWDVAVDSLEIIVWDPYLFMDNDQRLYLYWGCSNFKPIYGIELNYKENFTLIGDRSELFYGEPDTYGWERPDDYNNYSGRKKPWVEGAWVTKHNGTYYLQYSAPGTQFKSYADGVYVSNNPLGPYEIAANNPFSYKPEGFIAGAGHGSTFQDKYGNFWHMASMSISVKHKFERRLGLWPAFFDNDGTFYSYTAFGDFPHQLPQNRMKGSGDYQPSSLILSYHKPVEVSSTLPNYAKENATDENVRTSWSAESGNAGEWLMVDLQSQYKISAIQINFADVETTLLGRKDSIFYQYKIEYSTDKIKWKTLVDKTANTYDCPHDLIELPLKVSCRYVRLINFRVPDGKFALSGFRIFGNGRGKTPRQVSNFSCQRDTTDNRNAKLSWQKSNGAVGYNIRYGTSPEKLYLNYQVYDVDSLTIHSLNSIQNYYFTIDAFNESGITNGVKIIDAAMKN